jgi:hypothetical protein
MDVVFELVSRLAMSLEASYSPMLDALGRENVHPTDRPISESVETPPLLGVFSTELLDEFGGVEGLYDDPWYVATLTDGRPLVIDSMPSWSKIDWSKLGWDPPLEADYIETAEFR